ncbi:MAG: hypothetical protein RRB22_11580 [Gammaproteobacteria bacterium]|nr:hypothetical protein [Gammaproteobacteria bacterium]
MENKRFITAALAAALFLTAIPAYSADEEPIYGSQLMTQQERIEHRERLRSAQSAEEREKIRNEHHKRMQERAKAAGKSLPDEPPKNGGFMQPGGKGSAGGGGGGGGR